MIEAGKQAWLKPREELIEAKGLGCVQTYFAEPTAGAALTSYTSQSGSHGASNSDRGSVLGETVASDPDTHLPVLDRKSERLVDWIVEMLSQYLQQVVHSRQITKNISIQDERFGTSINSRSQSTIKRIQESHRVEGDKTTVVDEFEESINILVYHRDRQSPNGRNSNQDHLLSSQVKKQLLAYVSNICRMYNDENPFHNFDHASHVTMSVVKLIQRVVATPKSPSISNQPWAKYDHSYGLANDPLAQFACVFSAMIHDLDHPGCPNSQLVKENTQLAQRYNNKSIAEANSLDLAWDLLQQDQYQDLRNAIHSSKQEEVHFRQVLVNAVISTDIMDRDLKTIRESRWCKAFDDDDNGEQHDKSSNNVKATIVMEHMMQASDVAHTSKYCIRLSFCPRKQRSAEE